MIRKITVQVCAVNKGLFSAKKVIQAVNRVVFEKGSSYIEDVASQEKFYMEENKACS